MTLWDDTGTWEGMPEKVEAAVYDGLTEADQERIEHEAPDTFPNPETATAWGFEQGVFKDMVHARNAYDKLKQEAQPKTAEEMAGLWVADVQARVLAVEPEGNVWPDPPLEDPPEGDWVPEEEPLGQEPPPKKGTLVDLLDKLLADANEKLTERTLEPYPSKENMVTLLKALGYTSYNEANHQTMLSQLIAEKEPKGE